MSNYRNVERKYLVAIGVIDGETQTVFARDMSIEQLHDLYADSYIAMMRDEYDIDCEEVYSPDTVFFSDSPISQSGGFSF